MSIKSSPVSSNQDFTGSTISAERWKNSNYVTGTTSNKFFIKTQKSGKIFKLSTFVLKKFKIFRAVGFSKTC